MRHRLTPRDAAKDMQREKARFPNARHRLGDGDWN